ncbi:unnamed protein product, partial [Meganyctiphanes norvegica]
RFHIVTWNTGESQEIIKKITGEWPDEYKSRLLFTYHNATYPPGAERGRKPCATLRLYFPEMFPEIDAVVYLDTDTIFLRNPEELWDEFNKFDANHIVGQGPTANYHRYNPGK